VSSLVDLINQNTNNFFILWYPWLKSPPGSWHSNQKWSYTWLGLSDHDIVYVEAGIWLKRIRETPRKIFKYKKANSDNIKADLDIIHSDILKVYNTADIDSIWELFKTRLVKSMETNVPSKMLTYKHRLPWITNSLRKLISKKKNCIKNVMILNIVMLIKRSKHRYNKNSERHIGTTLNQSSVIYQ
jgi:hypothetical protein